MSTCRVRRIIDYLNTETRMQLKKLLPKGVATDATIKEIGNVKYPSALLNVLPKEEAYASLGNITEAMLRRPAETISLETLLEQTALEYPELSESDRAKVTKSVTTEPYLERLRRTREKLEASFQGPCVYEPTVVREGVEGHPDIKTMRQVYEIKLTGQVKENWLGFVFQAFAYAAICPKVREVNIVLPLQDLVWTYDVSNWTNRDAYWGLMNKLSEEIRTVGVTNKIAAALMCDQYCIGCHLPKRGGSFATSIAHIQDGSRGWQLFLSSNMTSKVSMKPEDIKATRAHIDRTGAKIYIHSPYIINLCAVPGEKDDYHTGCLCATLDAAVAMGCKGVVVHVGKSTTQDLSVALENMKVNIQRALASATPECPILLETPAGQGTETLKTYEEFVGLVKEINDPRLRICVDTCHVFACGHAPLEYVERMLKEDADLLKLIHFNDSLGECGSCVDRHADIGLGKVGIQVLEKIAAAAYAANVPCVIEY